MRFFVVFTWGSHDPDSHTTFEEVSESLPVLWIHVPEEPCYINNQSDTRALTQKSSNSLGAFPTRTPGQEPGDRTVGGWAIPSFWSKFFYKIKFHMVGSVFACVSPHLMACAPLDFIEQAGLFTEFSGIKEDFKFPGFNSPPETQAALPCCHTIFGGTLKITSCSPLLSGRYITWHLRKPCFLFYFSKLSRKVHLNYQSFSHKHSEEIFPNPSYLVTILSILSSTNFESDINVSLFLF